MFLHGQVSAQDKASGKKQKITITSDKGRLGKDEIERMIREAEENAEADKKTKERIEARNQLESYLYNVRTSVEDSLKDVLSAGDKETLLGAVKEGLQWLESHMNEALEVYETKRKEIESVTNPILSKAYAGKGSQPPDDSGDSSESSTGDDTSGPTVEEVD